MAGVKVLLVVWTVVCIKATAPFTTLPFTTLPPISLPPTTEPSTKTEVVGKIVSDLFNAEGYDYRHRPGTDEEPLDVYININVNDISYISETDLEYSMTLNIQQLWIDERLAYEDTGYNRNISLNYEWYDQMWTPDLYIVNLKTGLFHKVTTPNRRFRLSPNGVVYYGQCLSATMYCDMVLDRFPMDNQTCFLEMSSYAYPTNEVLFHWRWDAEPVEVTRAKVSGYSITNITSSGCTSSIEDGFPCLRAYFHLSRQLNKYLLSTYLPSFLVVLLSWLSFYINPDSAPARTSLGILTILVLTTQNSGLINSLPFGSAPKAIDVWMVTCLIFVFASFLEYAIVCFLMQMIKQMTLEDNSSDASGSTDVVGKLLDEKRSTNRRVGVTFASLFDFKKDPAMALERSSRIFFPVSFLIFCLIYWPHYLIG